MYTLPIVVTAFVNIKHGPETDGEPGRERNAFDLFNGNTCILKNLHFFFFFPFVMRTYATLLFYCESGVDRTRFMFVKNKNFQRLIFFFFFYTTISVYIVSMYL